MPSSLDRSLFLSSHLIDAKPPLFSRERLPSKINAEELLVQRLDDLPPMTVSFTTFQFSLESFPFCLESLISPKRVVENETTSNAQKNFISKCVSLLSYGKLLQKNIFRSDPCLFDLKETAKDIYINFFIFL